MSACDESSDGSSICSLATQEPFVSIHKKEVATALLLPADLQIDFELDEDDDLLYLPDEEEQTPHTPRVAASFKDAFGLIIVDRKSTTTRREKVRRSRESELTLGLKPDPYHHLNPAQTVKMWKRNAQSKTWFEKEVEDGPASMVKPRTSEKQESKKNPAQMRQMRSDMLAIRVYAEYPSNRQWYWGLITRVQEYNWTAGCFTFQIWFDDGDVGENIPGNKIFTIPEYCEHRALLWPKLGDNHEPPSRPQHLNLYARDECGNVIIPCYE
mmetsp:Transcript_12011/g.19929  ORF Transcript_12011/g.19929 Transcript_12011/m.19929 type:complete len:269 (+) Transcript_12011:57-863(+)